MTTPTITPLRLTIDALQIDGKAVTKAVWDQMPRRHIRELENLTPIAPDIVGYVNVHDRGNEDCYGRHHRHLVVADPASGVCVVTTPALMEGVHLDPLYRAAQSAFNDYLEALLATAEPAHLRSSSLEGFLRRYDALTVSWGIGPIVSHEFDSGLEVRTDASRDSHLGKVWEALRVSRAPGGGGSAPHGDVELRAAGRALNNMNQKWRDERGRVTRQADELMAKVPQVYIAVGGRGRP